MKYIKYAFLLLLLFAPLLSAHEGDISVLPEEKVHQGDYFSTGSSIEISGVVKGDVYAFGSQVIIDGQVEGDVISTGGTIHIGGEVLGNVRLAGGQVELDGKVGKNATIMAGSIDLSASSSIGGNLVATGGNVEVAGTVGGMVTLAASNARISGRIGKDVKAHVGQLRISSRASIGGELDYSSADQALIDSGAEIGGEIVYHPSAVREFVSGKWKAGLVLGSRYIGRVMNFLYSFVIGWILLKLFFPKVKRALGVLDQRPWKAFWVGILTAILLPVACVILFVTILGFPFALALVAISLIGFFAAKIFPILWVSNRIFPKFRLKPNSLGVLFLGLLAFFFLVEVPILGKVLSPFATMLGIGSVVLGRVSKGRSRTPRKSKARS